MNIENYTFHTGMGMAKNEDLPFLTEAEMEELNTIGYSGKNSNGKRTTREEYLNSLDKGTFKVTQTQFDRGDFRECFHITRVTDQNTNLSLTEALKIGVSGVDLLIDQATSDDNVNLYKKAIKVLKTKLDLTELKYKIVNNLVNEGLIKDCTDTDDSAEVDAENAIEEVLTEFFK